MSIIEQTSNSSPSEKHSMCTRELFKASAIFTPEPVITSGYEGDTCDLPQIVFAHETDELKNDYTSMFGPRFLNSGTYTFDLLDEDCNVVANLTDDTYGTFYAVGTWSELSQQYYNGFVVDWWKVYNAFGGGIYKLRTTRTSFVVGADADEYCSCKFLLMPYSDFDANETARIEVVFNSYFINSGEDYRGINWKQMYRVRGNFGLPEPQLERNNFLDTSRNITDIQDKIHNEYTLETYLVPYCFSSVMIPTMENKSLGSIADEIFITNYNLADHFRFERVPVILKDIKVKQQFNSSKVSYDMTFEDRARRNVKRTVR